MDKDLNLQSAMYSVIEQFLDKKTPLTIKKGGNKTMNVYFQSPITNAQIHLIVAYSDKKHSNSKIFGKCLEWIMFEKSEKIVEDHLYYCFVHYDQKLGTFRYFVVPNEKVVTYIKYEHTYWLNAVSTHRDNPFRAFRIGLFYEKYNHDVPMFYEYENKWEFIR